MKLIIRIELGVGFFRHYRGAWGLAFSRWTITGKESHLGFLGLARIYGTTPSFSSLNLYALLLWVRLMAVSGNGDIDYICFTLFILLIPNLLQITPNSFIFNFEENWILLIKSIYQHEYFIRRMLGRKTFQITIMCFNDKAGALINYESK